MKLRELINRLEELSENGNNDNFEVHIFEPYYTGDYHGMGTYRETNIVIKHKKSDIINIIV